MNIEQFDYELPPESVAQEPAQQRDASRLLVLPRDSGEIELRRFTELSGLLRSGDLLVVNDAKVLPVRLWAHRATGGVVELLLLRPLGDKGKGAEEGSTGPPDSEDRGSPGPKAGAAPCWEAMVRPSRRIDDDERLTIASAADAAGEPLEVRVVGSLGTGRRAVQLPPGLDVPGLLKHYGSMPLPPYIKRAPGDGHRDLDRSRYQTVYAKHAGAVAAPTAGLHFTEEVINGLRRIEIRWTTLTLQVGPGTFQPVRTERVEDHEMEPERYVIPGETAAAIDATRAKKGRVVAVGTSVVRALEQAAQEDGRVAAGEGQADLFILPGFRFRVVDAMITNFHLPRSTPILLVAALAGRQRLLDAYRRAIDAGFRFYSYGDAMLILP